MFARIFPVILSLCFGTAIAQGRPTGVHPSYVSIQMRSDPIEGPSILSSICGGVVVDDLKKIVATAWHCVPNTRALIEKPGIFIVGGEDAKLVAMASEADMALFQVKDLKGLKAAKSATPKKGDMIMASAYYDDFYVVMPMPDRYIPQVSINVTLDWEGKVNAIATATRRGGERGDQITKTLFKWIVVSGLPGTGFSGGPTFDKAGNFVGIISHGNGGFTTISSSENVLVLMKSVK